MSLITSCPACGTMFRVVADQLKISEGWVRCGHCSQIFDATAHLADEAAAPPQALQSSLAGAPAEGEAMVHAWETPAGAALTMPGPRTGAAPLNRTATQGGASDSLPDALPPQPALAGVEDDEAEAQGLGPSALDAPFVFRRSDLMEADPVPSVLPPAPDRRWLEEEREFELSDAVALEQASFVRQARRKHFWRRPLVRVLLIFFGLGLAALLLVQVGYQDRDRLAVAEPALRPALERMCKVLRCSIVPPRQIEALVIESSGFQRLRSDAYKLSFALRNTAPVQVAAPSMELTLTDGQDQALLRRVLAPEELGARDGVIAGGSEWTGAIGLVLDAGAAPRVAGYRLLAFYP